MKLAMELLAQVRDRDHWLRGEFPDLELAARVEKVLALGEQVAAHRYHPEYASAISLVMRLLNGEKP